MFTIINAWRSVELDTNTVAQVPPGIDNGAHGYEKLMLKIQVREEFA